MELPIELAVKEHNKTMFFTMITLIYENQGRLPPDVIYDDQNPSYFFKGLWQETKAGRQIFSDEEILGFIETGKKVMEEELGE